MLEKQIEDYWNVDGEKDLLDAWTGFTRFVLLKEKPPEGYAWSGERLTRKQKTSRPDDVWPDMQKFMSEAWTGSPRFTVLNEKPPNGYPRSRGDWRGKERPQDPTLYGQICGSICLMYRKAKRSKNGNARRLRGILTKFQCQQQCLVKHQQTAEVKPAAILGKARPNTLALSMPTKLWEYDWKVCRTGITKITSLKRNKFIEPLQFGA